MPVKVWDLPVRLCHWAFVVLIPAMWWTAENDHMAWHIRLGMMLLFLLTFRIAWGFLGSSTAKFSSFLRGPGAVLAYLRSPGGHSPAVIGHNAAGGWSVLAMLSAMLLQVGLGLFAGDPYDGSTGPLNHLVGALTADTLTDAHEVFFNLLAALILLHLLAVAFYLVFKRDNLVGPMITGKRSMLAARGGMEKVAAWRAVACLAVAALSAGWVWNGAPGL